LTLTGYPSDEEAEGGLMVARNRLVVGKYYWVIPEPAPTAYSAWEDGPQPARFVGRDTNGAPLWSCIGIEGVTNWPMRWVGHHVKEPAIDFDQEAKIASSSR
jgi:hypothetical protein